MSRRRFLKAAGLVGMGVALGACADGQGPSPQAAPGSLPSQGSAGSPFHTVFDQGRISSLKFANDRFETDYIRTGSRLGDLSLSYRDGAGEWQSAQTANLPANLASAGAPADARGSGFTCQLPAGSSSGLSVRSTFSFDGPALLWTVTAANLAGTPVEIGDLALPLPIGNIFARNQPATARVLKHSLISGHGSHLFWMRSNSAGPYLTLFPVDGAHLEYWDASREGYRVYIHSATAGADARSKGCRWRQPNTSLVLSPVGQEGDTKAYTFRFEWADDYDSVRRLLVDNGLIDVHVVPSMTVPRDLFARFALGTTQKIQSVDAEFPDSTKIKYLGAKGDYHIYQAQFEKLGENEITVHYGDGRRMYLEFFSTEPLETLIAKRAAFIAGHQFRDSSKWYNGLLAEWNMQNPVMLGPDNYDQIKGWRIYEVTCDDPGLGRPAYLAAKNAEYPVQAEVDALDYYIQHFVWGGLQRTTDETYSYAIYGIPDWKTNRDSTDPGKNGQQHFWRCYDYPHIILMYFCLYRLAKDHPEIKTALSSREYLERAGGTALAMFTIPLEITDWSAYETGFYNELVIVDLIAELEANGMADQATQLRNHWERKVRYFVAGAPDLFGSEYPFDSTGFESTHALAKYALDHAGGMGISRQDAQKFLEIQMAANIFCRGWLETAYYLLGSDYRANGGNSYTLTYMSQMGGWAVLDYSLNYTADPFPYLRLGYASYLSSWALMNSGDRDSNYGFWFPGEENDGGAGGGFEPAPYGETWLGQPHHRGSWYYSCEINLGYCGALRAAATVLADDPLFGRFCYGGDWKKTSRGVEVVPKDGVRRRFHAVLSKARASLLLENDRFATDRPITLTDDLSQVSFSVESDNVGSHMARLRVSLPSGRYRVHGGPGVIGDFTMADDQETIISLPVAAGAGSHEFGIGRAA